MPPETIGIPILAAFATQWIVDMLKLYTPAKIKANEAAYARSLQGAVVVVAALMVLVTAFVMEGDVPERARFVALLFATVPSARIMNVTVKRVQSTTDQNEARLLT